MNDKLSELLFSKITSFFWICYATSWLVLLVSTKLQTKLIWGLIHHKIMWGPKLCDLPLGSYQPCMFRFGYSLWWNQYATIFFQWHHFPNNSTLMSKFTIITSFFLDSRFQNDYIHLLPTLLTFTKILCFCFN